MARYLFIESTDPLSNYEDIEWYRYISALSESGHHVSIYYVNEGVTATRAGARTNLPFSMIASGVNLFADEWSIRERGMTDSLLIDGIEITSTFLIVDALASGDHVVWH